MITVGALGLAACGEDSSTEDSAGAEDRATTPTQPEAVTSAPPAPDPPPVRSATIRMGAPGEFAMTPAPVTLDAGTSTFTIVNDGTIEHEVVFMRTDIDSGALPTTAKGAAIESRIVAPVAAMKEMPGHHGTHVHAGKRKKIKVRLPRGQYALVCNLPGHYAAGMHANLVVS